MSINPITPIQQCLDRLRAGDEAAWNELIRLSRERLSVITRRMLRRFAKLRRWEQTEDVLQAALERLVEYLRKSPRHSTAAFFAAASKQINWTLTNLTRHYFGPQGQACHHVTPATRHPHEADDGDDPALLAQWAELHQRVATMPPEEREVFGLLWYMDLSQEDAAKVLGVSVKTIKRRWMKARLHLKGLLGEGGTSNG